MINTQEKSIKRAYETLKEVAAKTDKLLDYLEDTDLGIEEINLLNLHRYAKFCHEYAEMAKSELKAHISV